MKKLSIAIVTFNSEEVIGKCLESIRKFIPNDLYTVYVYDNASTDLTIQKISQFKDIDLKVILGKNNIGFGSAHNELFKAITTPYVLVLNPDTEFIDNQLGNALEFLEANNSVGILTFKMLDANRNLFFNCHRYPSFLNLVLRRIPLPWFNSLHIEYSYMKNDYSKIFEVDWCSGAFLLIRAKVFGDKQLFDNKYFMYFEDVDICKNVWKMNYKVIYYPTGQIIHHWKQESKRSFKLKKYLIFSMLYYFKKWGFKLF